MLLAGATRAPKFVLYDQRTVPAHAREVARGSATEGDSALPLDAIIRRKGKPSGLAEALLN